VSATVYKFRRPGQCCGLCMHMKPSGGRYGSTYLCVVISGADGRPADLPVEPAYGTHCSYFRAKAPK
jgi:hypothetical protein